MQLHVFLLLLMITEVQEVVTNSSEQRSSPESEQGFSTTTAAWSEPGVSDTIRASPKAARGMEEGESLPSSEPVGVDVPGPGVDISLRGRGQPQTPAGPGLAVAGGTDRNTPPLPQEARDNGVDMSGAARVTQGHGSPKENTHKYTHTQPTSTADTPSVAVLNMSAATHSGSPHVFQRDALPRTGKVNTVGYNTVTDTQPATDINTSTQSVKHTDIHTNIHTTQTPLALSRSRAPSPPSSLPRSLPTSGAPNRPLQTGALLTPRGGYVGGGPGESQTPAWRTQRSADELRSGRTLWPARREDSGSTDAELVTAATPFTQRPVTTDPSQNMDSSERDSATQAMSSHPDVGQTSAPVYLHYDTTSRPPESKVTDGLGGGDMLHATSPHLSPAPARTQTDDPQGRPTGALAPSLSPVSQNDNNLTDVSSRHISSASSSPKESPGSVSSERSPEVTRAPVWTTRPPRSPSSDTAAVPGTVASTIFSDDAMKTDSENDADGEVTQPGADVSACALCPAESSSTAALPHPHTSLPTGSFTPTPLRPTVDDVDASRDRDRFQTQSTAPTALQPTDRLLTSYTTSATTHVIRTEHRTTLAHLPTPPKTQTPASSHVPQTSPSSAEVSPTCDRFRDHMTTTQTALLSQTPSRPELGPGVDGRAGEGEPGRSVVTATPSRSFLSPPTARPSPAAPVPGAGPHPGQDSPVAGASSAPPGTDWGPTTTTQKPRFYIVPDRPATIRVDSIELLLQIVVDEYSSAFTSGLEIYTSAWVRPFLQKAPGYSRLLRVWSRGFVVQSLVEFKTRAALDWLGKGGPDSLLEHTGLAHAVREEWRFKGSRITNVTVGGLQGEVCDWLLQCPAGYACVFQPGAVNHSCSSVCNYDYCHHHGICTHHPDQLPVCRCLAGQDFWFMGQRCDVKMTRARLVGACLAILVIVVTLIAVMALVAVRRYRAILIKAKVDQTRSSYRRFNHFDELSGRFWQRSAAASADSLDNPAFTRSDELLHLRALDRTCCYHDDTLSLASTCPSNGTHLNTVFPHSSQYGWRGSQGSMAECVLDSGKASDLSVCSWPVEPIQWTPFPLLQQLASHRTNAVRPSRTRSYCEGMELVDLGKSWTA